MKRLLGALIAGALFGVGLAVSRMTDPTVVLGFLDIAGNFNPALAFVMAGAVTTTALAYRLILRRGRPLFEHEFRVPESQRVDLPLVLGAVLFGVGWGLAGYCPGPALVAATSGVGTAWIFLPAMLAGSLLHRLPTRSFVQ